MSEKKILFMDDRTKRINEALARYTPENGYQLTIVANARECLRYMSREDWDIVSLDHDMNGSDFQDPDDHDCGMEIVRYLWKTAWPKYKPKPMFWVHSSNLFAATLMLETLNKIGFSAYYRKFDYEITHKKRHIPIPPDTWVLDHAGTCKSCDNHTYLDKKDVCHNCDTVWRVNCAQ